MTVEEALDGEVESGSTVIQSNQIPNMLFELASVDHQEDNRARMRDFILQLGTIPPVRVMKPCIPISKSITMPVWLSPTGCLYHRVYINKTPEAIPHCIPSSFCERLSTAVYRSTAPLVQVSLSQPIPRDSIFCAVSSVCSTVASVLRPRSIPSQQIFSRSSKKPVRLSIPCKL